MTIQLRRAASEPFARVRSNRKGTVASKAVGDGLAVVVRRKKGLSALRRAVRLAVPGAPIRRRQVEAFLAPTVGTFPGEHRRPVGRQLGSGVPPIQNVVTHLERDPCNPAVRVMHDIGADAFALRRCASEERVVQKMERAAPPADADAVHSARKGGGGGIRGMQLDQAALPTMAPSSSNTMGSCRRSRRKRLWFPGVP